jgi:hypothetical protein
MVLRMTLAGAALISLLTACALIDPVDSRYDTVSRSFDKARNEAIFLNLVRARHNYPLEFATIPNMTPTLTNVSTLSLPSFGVGPPFCFLSTVKLPATRSCSAVTPGRDTIFSNSTASNNTTARMDFSVATQEQGSFYTGILKPIDLITLDYFIRQDYPRELLFWLFADSFQFGPPGPAGIGYYYNPPDSYGCPRDARDVKHSCFKEWVLIAVLSGLTVEEQTIQKPETAKGNNNQNSDNSSSNNTTGAKKPPPKTIVPRFCFSPVLAEQAKNRLGPELTAKIGSFMPFDPNTVRPICGTKWDPTQQAKQPQADTFELNIGRFQFRIVSRSAFGVFQFLGNLMRVEDENIQPSDKAFVPRADEAGPPQMHTTPSDPNLITVLRQSDERCFSHTWFYDGDYCVPESAANTKRIFSLLAQLTAIETEASDLAITPIVRVIQ